MNRATIHFRLVIASAVMLGSLSFGASAQGKFPERAVRLVVPFAPGGATDILARRFAAKIPPLLGQQMVVENKAAGAGGAAGTAEVARAKPDGYTLGFGTSSTHAIDWLTMENPPYDPVKDFAPIAVIGIIPIALAAHPTIAGSLQQLIKNVKAKPGQYSYSSSGIGGINHFSGELFKKQAGGLDILHVPYRGSGPGVQAVIAGQLPIAVSAFSAVGPYHLSGKLRILAVFSEKRSTGAPDIPTAIEQGVPAMLAYTLDAIFVPAATPRPIIDRLYQATAKVMADKAFQKELESIGIESVTDSTPEKAVQTIKDEIAKWAPIVKATGVKAH